MTGKNEAKKDKHASQNKFDVLSHDDRPCSVCSDDVPSPADGFQCERCHGWVHSMDKCSQLNKQQFKFMEKWVLPAIQYICLRCRETESENPDHRDAAAKNAAKLESFGESLAVLKKQNKEIIDFVKKNAKTDDSIKVHVTEAIDHQKEKEERKFNLIFYNIPESDSKTNAAHAELEDLQNAKNVVNYVCPSFDHSSLKSVARCGNRREANAQYPSPKPRPIKIVLHNPLDVLLIRRNARNLKHNEALKHVGISEDKTYKERLEERELRAELIRRRNEDEDVVIYNKKVLLKSEIAKMKENSAVTGTGNSKAAGPAPGARAVDEGGAGPQH